MNLNKIMVEHAPDWDQWSSKKRIAVEGAMKDVATAATAQANEVSSKRINTEIGRYLNLKSVVQKHFTIRSDFLDSIIDARMSVKP